MTRRKPKALSQFPAELRVELEKPIYYEKPFYPLATATIFPDAQARLDKEWTAKYVEGRKELDRQIGHKLGLLAAHLGVPCPDPSEKWVLLLSSLCRALNIPWFTVQSSKSRRRRPKTSGDAAQQIRLIGHVEMLMASLGCKRKQALSLLVKQYQPKLTAASLNASRGSRQATLDAAAKALGTRLEEARRAHPEVHATLKELARKGEYVAVGLLSGVLDATEIR